MCNLVASTEKKKALDRFEGSSTTPAFYEDKKILANWKPGEQFLKEIMEVPKHICASCRLTFYKAQGKYYCTGIRLLDAKVVCLGPVSKPRSKKCKRAVNYQNTMWTTICREASNCLGYMDEYMNNVLKANFRTISFPVFETNCLLFLLLNRDLFKNTFIYLHFCIFLHSMF